MGERNVTIALIATVFVLSVILILVNNFHLEPTLDPAAPDEKDRKGSWQVPIRNVIFDIECGVHYGDLRDGSVICSGESISLEPESPIVGIDVRLPHIG